MNHISIGSFVQESDEMMISDPCYERDTWCQGIIPNVKSGKWNAHIAKHAFKSWGERVVEIVAIHSDYDEATYQELSWNESNIEVGVDSGQAGIFDNKFYDPPGPGHSPIKNPDSFYAKCCEKTGSKQQAGVLPHGAVSSSGFGDGGYKAYEMTEYGKVYAVKIEFICCDEMDEEDGEDEGEDDEDEEIVGSDCAICPKCKATGTMDYIATGRSAYPRYQVGLRSGYIDVFSENNTQLEEIADPTFQCAECNNEIPAATMLEMLKEKADA